MRFFAKLKRNSSIDQDWRTRKRLSGTLDGVKFKLVGFNGTYASDEITEEQITKIKARQDQAILIEMISTAPKFEEVPIPTVEDTPKERPRLQASPRRRR